MYQIISLIIVLITTLVYNGYVIKINKDIPESLSATAYILGGFKRYFFTLYCVIIGMGFLPHLFEITNENYQFIPFLMIAGLLFAGFTPSFKDGLDKKVHYISSYVSFIALLFFMLVCTPKWFIMLYFLIFIALCRWKNNSFVYFGEILSILLMNIWLFFQ